MGLRPADGGEKRTSEAAQVAIETALAVLHRGGFDAEHAAEIARSALFSGIMLAMSEPGYEPSMSEPERREYMRQTRGLRCCRQTGSPARSTPRRR